MKRSGKEVGISEHQVEERITPAPRSRGEGAQALDHGLGERESWDHGGGGHHAANPVLLLQREFHHRPYIWFEV
jgi:hypothetical protein